MTNKEYKYYRGSYKYITANDFAPRTRNYILRKNSNIYEIHDGKRWRAVTSKGTDPRVREIRGNIEEISKEDVFLELL